MTEVTFTAYGDPVTRGSTKGYRVGRHVKVTDTNRERLLPWLDTVRAAAAETGFFAPRGEAVEIDVQFFLRRPKSLPKRKPVRHTKKPDGDKLVRSVLDSLSGTIYADDSQVDRHSASKQYVALEPGAQGDEHRPRAVITIRRPEEAA